MAKPTSIFHWCTTGTRTAPSSGKQDSGWAYGDQLPSSQLNYLWGVLADWMNWINTYCPDTSAANTWSGTQSLSAGYPLAFSGAGSQIINKPTGSLFISAGTTTMEIRQETAGIRYIDVGSAVISSVRNPINAQDADTLSARQTAMARTWPSPSLSCGTYNLLGSEAMVTNLSVSCVPRGNNPVLVTMGPAAGDTQAYVELNGGASGGLANINITLIRSGPGGDTRFAYKIAHDLAANTTLRVPAMFTWLDSPSWGNTATYKIYAWIAGSGTATGTINNAILRVVELSGYTS